MSLEQANVIDALGTEVESGTLVLTVLDSWDWTAEDQHLLQLQEKLNAYFQFIETGQLEEHARLEGTTAVRIDVVFRFDPPPTCQRLLAAANTVAEALSTPVSWRVVPDWHTAA